MNRHANRTYTFAFLLSALTVYTPAFVFGPPTFGSTTESLIQRLKWISLFAEFKYVLVNYPTMQDQ
jgi:phosphatidylinositol glycan class F